MGEVDVSTMVVIDRPRAVVAGFASDPTNVPRWYVNIKSVVWKSPPRVVVGSQISFVAHFLGQRLEYTYEIAEWVPQERLVMRTTDGPFPMETHYTWEAAAEASTRMTLRNRGKPAGFSMLFAPVMSFMIRRATQQDLQRLKGLLENTPCENNKTRPTLMETNGAAIEENEHA